MKVQRKLDRNQTTLSVRLESMRASTICVNNYTGSAIAVRVANSDIPTLANADELVPANTQRLFPVDGTDFGFAFTDPAAVNSPALSNLLTTATILFLTADEVPPALGSANFLSLALSELTSTPPTFGAGGHTSQTFDLGSWGGAVVYVYANPGSGQALLTIQASANQTAWFPVGAFGIWPGVPATLNLPRVMRYLRLVFTDPGIPSNPALSGTYTVRAALAEIFERSYAPTGGSLVLGVNVPNLSQQDFVFITAGLQAITVGFIASLGTSAEMVVYTGNSPAGPWELVTLREQTILGFYNSMYRSIGNLGLYTKISMLDIDVDPSGISGNLNVLINPAPDTTSILSNIYLALGDVRQPTSANQSIYHMLDRLRIQTDAVEGNLSTMITQLDSIYSAVNDLETLVTELRNNHTTTSQILSNPFTVPGLGAWYNTGLDLTANGYVQGLSYSWRVGGTYVSPNRILFGIGTSGTVVGQIFGGAVDEFSGSFPFHKFDSMLGGGYKLGTAGNTRLWIFADSENVAVQLNLSYK